MELSSDSISHGQPIATRHAMGKPDPQTHATFSDNVNPHLSWSGAPAETASFAIIVKDTEVPTVADDVNQEGRTVPIDLPRADFFHWILIDIPPTVSSIAEGSHADGVVNGGKEGPQAPQGAIHGINSYREWFSGDPDMGGDYYGYDGPFPPWNDERIHSYEFTVYALDVDKLDVPNGVDGPTALAAIEGHVLDSATIVAPYKINPDVNY